MIIDPECPYCEKFMNTLRPNSITNNLVQVRIVPVGFHGAESIQQAAFLLAAPNAQQLYFRQLDGDKTALPASPDINTQGVQHNMSIIQTWKLNATPTTVYRAKNGQIKIFQGGAKDIGAFISDIAPPRS
jgi:thiol:disulfide interchange protein DsbG